MLIQSHTQAHTSQTVDSFFSGVIQVKPHHILTVSDLEDTRRVRRHSPHSQTTGPRSHMPPPPLGPLTGPITLRAGKSSLPTSPLFPLGAPDNLINSPSSRPGGGRSASSVRCPGNTMTHCTSSFFPQSPWQDSAGSFPSPSLSFSPSIQHLPRNRLSFDLNQPDSVEVPHNFLASPEPEDVSPANGTSPQGDLDQQKDEEEFPYSSFHKDPNMSLSQEMRTELEIEETLLNEGVAMNCGGQIVVEGDDQEEFWGRSQEVHKRKTLVANLPRSAASGRDDLGNTSSDDDMEHYFDFSRTIVSCPGSKDHSKSPSSPSSRPMAQLDGVDDGTESDASIATNEDAQKVEGSSQAQIRAKSLNNKNVPESDTTNGTQAVQSLFPKPSSNDKHTDSSSVTISAASKSPTDSPQDPPKSCDASQTNEDNMGFVSPQISGNSPLKEQSSDTPSVHQETVLPTPVCDALPNLLTKVPETSFSEELFQGSSLGFASGTPLVLESCVASPHLTEMDPLLGGTPLDSQQSEACKSLSSEANSSNSAVLMNHLAANTMEPSLTDADNSQDVLLDLLQPSPVLSTDVQNPSHGLVDSLQMYPCLPGFSQPPLTSITLQPVTSSQEATTFPSMRPLSTKLTTLTTVGDVTQTLLNDPVLSATSGTCPPAGTCGTVSLPIYSTQTQPLGSTAVSIVSSSASLSGLSTHCSTAPMQVQTTAAPVILNGYSSSSVQKEATSGHTISINFSTPRPALEPQQPVVPQALPGHAILTVKEVGGPNVDPTPHVLLVNRLGQIFVKNPESNTFQLPTPTSPSYNCVTQIASLLQSNALSATLAAAGNMTAPPPHGANVATAVPPSVTPTVQNPTTITQLLTHNSNGAVASVNAKKPRKSAKTPKDETAPELKKTKKKKDSSASRKSKSAKASGLPAPSTENPPMTPAESAQAIINQAMASNYTPKWSGLRTLSPSELVLPPGLLIEPEPPAVPPSPSVAPTPAPAPRPRTHVRMKRVSSLSDRIVTKKSKVDFLKPEPPSEEEEQRRKPSVPSISSRASGVRIKTPTVKGVLNLDQLKEEHISDSDSSG